VLNLSTAIGDPHAPAQLPPPKFVFRDDAPGDHSRRGEAHDSMVARAASLGATVRRASSRRTSHQQLRQVDDSILSAASTSAGTPAFAGHHRQGRKIPPGTTIGYDLNRDRKRGLLSPSKGVSSRQGESTESFTLILHTTGKNNRLWCGFSYYRDRQRRLASFMIWFTCLQLSRAACSRQERWKEHGPADY